MSKKNAESFVKIGLIYIISNVIIKGIAFLTTPLFTRLMSQEAYGQFSNVSSWASIMSIVCTLGLHSTVSTAKYDYAEQIEEYMASITILGSMVTGCFWIVVELNMSSFEKILCMDKMCIRSIMLYLLFMPAVETLITKYRMYNEYKQVIILTWLTLLTSTGASLLLTIFMENKLLGRTLGTYGVVAVVDSFIWIYVVLKGKKFKFDMCKYACMLAIPLLIHQLSGVLLNSSDRIIINQLCGPTDAALYSIAYTIAMIITVLLSSVNQAWVPWFYDRLEREEYCSIKKYSKVYAFIFTMGCMFLMLIGPEMIMIFGGKQYIRAVNVIPPVCLAIELQFVYTFYVNIEFFLKKTAYISLATVLATVINIGLNYLLIPKGGYVVAAYTTVIGYGAALIFHFIICKKLHYQNVFDNIFFVFNILFSIGTMIISLLLYRHTIVRYIIISALIIALIIGILTRKRWYEALKKWMLEGEHNG